MKRPLMPALILAAAMTTQARADCDGLKGSDFTRCKNAQGQREIGGWRNPSPSYTPSETTQPRTPDTTYRPTPRAKPPEIAMPPAADPISLSRDLRLLELHTLGRVVALPPMGITEWYASGWWPNGTMQPVTFRVQQGNYKYQVEISLQKMRCDDLRPLTLAWLQGMTAQDRASTNHRTLENRNFDPRWYREYWAWQDNRNTVTELCLDIATGDLEMRIRAFETDAFDSDAIRTLTRNLADALLPSPERAVATARPESRSVGSAPGTDSSHWELLYSIGDKSRVYVDRSTVSRSGDTASIMALRESSEASSRFKVEALCSESKWRIAYSELLAEPMAQGRVLKRDDSVFPWNEAKGKATSLLLRAACSS